MQHVLRDPGKAADLLHGEIPALNELSVLLVEPDRGVGHPTVQHRHLEQVAGGVLLETVLDPVPPLLAQVRVHRHDAAHPRPVLVELPGVFLGPGVRRDGGLGQSQQALAIKAVVSVEEHDHQLRRGEGPGQAVHGEVVPQLPAILVPPDGPALGGKGDQIGDPPRPVPEDAKIPFPMPERLAHKHLPAQGGPHPVIGTDLQQIVQLWQGHRVPPVLPPLVNGHGHDAHSVGEDPVGGGNGRLLLRRPLAGGQVLPGEKYLLEPALHLAPVQLPDLHIVLCPAVHRP